jgi:hypothetical protein
MSGEQREARPIIISQEKGNMTGCSNRQHRTETAHPQQQQRCRLCIPSIFLFFLSKTIENFFFFFFLQVEKLPLGGTQSSM